MRWTPALVALLLLAAGCQLPPSVSDGSTSAPDSARPAPDGPLPDTDTAASPDSAGEVSPADSAKTPSPLARQHPDDVRLVSYNIYMDSVFTAGSQPSQRFARLVKALDADVWALQEVYKTPAADVAKLLDTLAPLAGGRKWQARYGGDNVTVSRFPITLHHFQTTPSCGRKVSLDLVDLPDARYGRDLYLLNNHFTCCGGVTADAKRQQEADQLVAWMRDARTTGGAINLVSGAVMAVVGDLNIVGGPQPLKTIVSGDIVDEATFGKDSPPDWDGTALTDARPLHNGAGSLDYTWRWDGSGYNPGRLDYVIYTDSVANVGASFVLNTVTMTQQQLKATGLQADDVIHFKTAAGQYAFDHLPVVVDLRIKK